MPTGFGVRARQRRFAARARPFICEHIYELHDLPSRCDRLEAFCLKANLDTERPAFEKWGNMKYNSPYSARLIIVLWKICKLLPIPAKPMNPRRGHAGAVCRPSHES
jgi:hypothetical protein